MTTTLQRTRRPRTIVRRASLAAVGMLLALTFLPAAAAAQANLALGGTATQSSDWVDAGGTATADRAIDGHTNGSFPAGSVSHTAGGPDSAPFWELDLGEDRQLDDIVIWNRTDCCADRLYDFTVTVRTGGSSAFLYGPFSMGAEPSFHLPLGVVGRYVTIQMQLDPNNLSERYLSLAEVEVFGPLDEGELPLGSTLVMQGRWERKLNSTIDGPKKAVEKLLKALRKAGIRRSKVPKKCSESEDGITLGQIRFDSEGADDSGRFQMSTIDGQVVFGDFERGGREGQKVSLRVDDDSERAFKRMLQKSASDCFEIDAGEDPDEQLKKMKAKLKSYTLEGSVENGTLTLVAKIKGSAKWASKARKLGKLKGSGKVSHKLTISAPIDQERPSVGPACLSDQGVHVYPTAGAQFEGWIEMTEIQNSDRYYLILSDAFVEILEDFEESSAVVRAVLKLLDQQGSPCDLSGRSVVSVTLTEFGKDNFLYVIDYLEQVELQITAFKDYLEREALRLAFDTVFGSSPTGDFANELFACFVEETAQEIFDDEELKNTRCKNGFP